MKTGQARKGAQLFHLTTAYPFPDTRYIDIRKHVEAIMDPEQTVDDDRTFGLLYAIDPDDDPHDKSCWIKANPSLGHTFEMDWLENEYDQAKNSPLLWNEFQTFHLNRWGIGTGDQWMPTEKWIACGSEEPPDGYESTPAYIGVDTSGWDDLTVVCILHMLSPNSAYVQFQCWTTNNKYQSVSDQLKIRYDKGIDEDVLIRQNAATIDQGEVYDFIADYADKHDVRKIVMDHYKSQRLYQRLFDKFGEKKIGVSTSAASFVHPAMEEAARIILAGRMHHVKSEFITWQFSNTAVQKSKRTGYNYIDKQYGEEYKIDAIAAMLHAVKGMEEPEKQEADFVMAFLDPRTGKMVKIGKDSEPEEPENEQEDAES